MKRILVAVVVVAALGVVGFMAYTLLWKETAPVQTGTPPGSITAQDLEAAAGARVFFGHQSVGANMISGIPPVYAEQGLTPPEIVDSAEAIDGEAFFENAPIGENGDPAGKLAAFQQVLKGGVGDSVDVAFMKFCYVDITAATDVQALFDEYRTTMASLEQAFPDVTFLYVTTPIMTDQTGTKARVKAFLGRGDGSGPADNAARERFNALMRQEYAGTGRLIDLAAAESTAPDGRRVTGSFEGQTYYALYPGYASDPGHLNDVGSQVAAAEMLKVIAAAQSGS